MAADEIRWYPKRRNYLKEARDSKLERRPAKTHPLATHQKPTASDAGPIANGPSSSSSRTSNVNKAQSSSNPTRVTLQTSGFIDPLSQLMGGEDVVMYRGGDNVRSTATNRTPVSKEQLLGPWATKKESILAKFTTTEKLTLTSSYLSGDDRVVTVTKSNLLADRIQTRLEQLDYFEAGSVKEMLNLSQQEYINRIDQLHAKLQSAWQDDQRVTALKMAIQLAKLLSDTHPLQFYPSKFVLVTDVLETFGQLIYDRILDKSGNGVIGDTSSLDRIPEAAKETCRNWFFKVASIRELLPRLYIEISIMRCYMFLEPRSAYLEIIPRFAQMIRGIGDHLVASYARCYLTRMIIQLAPETMPRFLILVQDFVTMAQQIQLDKLERRLSEQRQDMSSYLLLHQPALEWITECYGRQTGEAGMQQLLSIAETSNYSGLLLNCIMTSYKAELVANHALQICGLIQKAFSEDFPTHILCRTLGLCLLGGDTDPKERKKIMNEMWGMIVEQKDPHNYISAAEIWVEFAAKFFTVKEVNRVLGDIVAHLLPDRAYEKCASTLLQILEKVVRHLRNFSLLLSMDKLMPFLDMIQKEDVRCEAAKILLESYAKYERGATTDPVLINGIMYTGKIIHDSITSLSSDDEKRNATVMVCGFISSVDYGRDYEQQLNFYADCRGAFSNLDDVVEFLVKAVNNLTMSTRSIQQGHHTRRTAAFVRACVAFSFITIPSLCDVPSQLNLYLESAQVALANQCLGQADALIKAAIQLFNSSRGDLETFATKLRPASKIAVEFVSNLLSLLLTVPDPPEQGMLYLVRGVLNSIQKCEPEVQNQLQLQLLSYASAARQEEYLYHIDGIDSNDRLYGPDPDFLEEIDNLASSCLTALLTSVQELKTTNRIPQAVKLAQEVVDVIFAHGDISRMIDMTKGLAGFLKTHGAPVDTRRLQVIKELLPQS